MKTGDIDSVFPIQKGGDTMKKKIEYVNREYVSPATQAEACNSLNGAELRLYLYMLDMANVYREGSFLLDRWEVMNNYGVAIASYQRALNGLKRKGYLQRKDGSTLVFDAVGKLLKEGEAL